MFVYSWLVYCIHTESKQITRNDIWYKNKQKKNECSLWFAWNKERILFDKHQRSCILNKKTNSFSVKVIRFLNWVNWLIALIDNKSNQFYYLNSLIWMNFFFLFEILLDCTNQSFYIFVILIIIRSAENIKEPLSFASISHKMLWLWYRTLCIWISFYGTLFLSLTKKLCIYSRRY